MAAGEAAAGVGAAAGADPVGGGADPVGGGADPVGAAAGADITVACTATSHSQTSRRNAPPANSFNQVKKTGPPESGGPDQSRSSGRVQQIYTSRWPA
jgi:hypothetical protein